MSTEPQRTCPSCGNEFSGTLEFCPVCMLRKGLAAGVQSGESSLQETVRRTPNQPPKRFEHYELVTGEDGRPVELGRGAMGVTYKAFDVNLRCPVTLKVISERYLGDESARLRFLREARAAASVRHTNVASVFHLGRTGENYFYAMEFVEGETLDKLIKRSGRLEVKPALEITTQVAAGLAAIHKQHLVHRDIKPSNIMVSLENEGGLTAKVIDLGLAKAITEPSLQTAISTPRGFVGTPEFASPEQFAGLALDTRSDLYSLGITLWEMMTGRTPFRGTPSEVMYQHQHTPLQGATSLVERRILLSWTMHGQTSRSMLLQLLPGAESENRRWSTIGSDEWRLNTIVLRNSYLAGLSTDRAPVGRLRQRMNFLTWRFAGLATQIRASERRGRRAKDWPSSSRIVEPCLFWTVWSRSKIRLVHKKDGCVSLPSRRSCGNSLHSIRGFA